MLVRLRTGNLPADESTFVGRRREISHVKRMLAGSRLVTVTGPPGVGKSRLAHRVALESQDGCPDGVWWVGLAGVTEPEMVATTVAATLGLDDPTGSSLLPRLLDYLADKRALLVLDNCEHLCAPITALTGRLL